MIDWHGKSISLFAVTTAMLALALIVVPLRCIVRISRASFKLDDWLIVAALIFHTGACAITYWGFMHGLAMKDQYLTEDQVMKGVQAFAMFKPIYTLSTCLIKCSICCTLLRLATTDPNIRKSLYWIMGAVTGSSTIMLIGSFFYCFPYPAIWTHWQHPHTPGYCLPGEFVLTVAYVFAATTIITDFACAVIPALILWNSCMKTRTKIMAWLVLGCGLLAGIATACRLPYIMYWVYKHDKSYGLGRILLFEIIECGLGIFASCAPALKPLLLEGMTICTSLFNRFSIWTTVTPSSSQDSSNRSYLAALKKAEAGGFDHPQPAVPKSPLQNLDLMIPDIEDTIVDTSLDDERDEDKKQGQVPGILAKFHFEERRDSGA